MRALLRPARELTRTGILLTFYEHSILNSPRSKRWSGKFDTLPADYLKAILEKMADYGDRVQFSLVSSGPQPSYQVINTLDKKMAFDKNHHLLSAADDEFAGANASAVFTLDQIKAMIAGVSVSSGTGTRTARVVRAGTGTGRTTAAKLNEQFATQRYEYFRNNRQSLPPAISEHSSEITALMMQGKSVEEAFGEVVKKYF